MFQNVSVGNNKQFNNFVYGANLSRQNWQNWRFQNSMKNKQL